MGEAPSGVTPPPSKDVPALITVTGTVTAGVEPGCLLLGTYLLVGGPTDVVREGARVTVTGRVEAELATTCQQGVPLRVEDARPAVTPPD
jgi:hypothetical protein